MTSTTSSSNLWIFDSNDGAKGRRAFSRPLGNEELGFYWDSAFSGTATTVQNFEISVADPALLSEQNIVRTWLRIKGMFPLLACKIVEGEEGSNTARFCLEEERLRTNVPGEVEVHDVHSDADVDSVIEEILNGPPMDCSKLVSRVLALRRRDKPGFCRVITVVAHCVVDGMANATLVRSFCDELCSPTMQPAEGLIPIEKRLTSLLPLEDLYPNHNTTRFRSLWRRAAAKDIFRLRQEKLTGGQTLPRRLTPSTFYNPAQSKQLGFTFSEDISSSIIANCRAQKLTFGNALHVISQLAHSRVLHRLRLQESQYPGRNFGITKNEWESRIRQPMHFGGPLNLRPFLSPEWYKNGGSTDICLSINFWFISLPSMPFSKRPVEQWATNFPTFDELMSRARFKHRVDLVKRKMSAVLGNPLFLEISAVRMPFRTDRSREVAMVWRSQSKNPGMDLPSDPPPPIVLANGGASLGNRDVLIPDNYPLRAKSDSKPRVRIERQFGHLRCRPTELYLGALMRHKQLQYFVYYDGNVFDEKIVTMWLEEVKQATLHYLTTGPAEEVAGSEHGKSKL